MNSHLNRVATTSLYDAQNMYFFFIFDNLHKKSFKIKYEDVWFVGKSTKIFIIALSLRGISKEREYVIFCRFEEENIASTFEEEGLVSTRLLRLL